MQKCLQTRHRVREGFELNGRKPTAGWHEHRCGKGVHAFTAEVRERSLESCDMWTIRPTDAHPLTRWLYGRSNYEDASGGAVDVCRSNTLHRRWWLTNRSRIK